MECLEFMVPAHHFFNDAGKSRRYRIYPEFGGLSIQKTHKKIIEFKNVFYTPEAQKCIVKINQATPKQLIDYIYQR